jgi:hypothetical protein
MITYRMFIAYCMLYLKCSDTYVWIRVVVILQIRRFVCNILILIIVMDKREQKHSKILQK